MCEGPHRLSRARQMHSRGIPGSALHEIGRVHSCSRIIPVAARAHFWAFGELGSGR